MKRIVTALLLVLTSAAAAFAASFNIDEQKTIDLSGKKKIIFELDHPNCALCINTGHQTYSLTGGGADGVLSLSLEGDLKSNNRKAVPSLIVDESGSVLTVRLYAERNLFFGLVQNGSVHFNAELPEYFHGDIEFRTSSGDTSAVNINTGSILLKASSGDTAAENIEADQISIEASSGRISARSLSAVRSVDVKSSSGDIELDDILAQNASVKASSGRIVIGRMRATEEVTVHASSGRITAVYLEGDSVSVDATSGRITIQELKANSSSFDASSGDITVSGLSSGDSDFRVSSGRLTVEVAELNGDMNIKSSSGSVNIKLPKGAAFDADLSASSGRIRSAFKLLGEVTGKDRNEVIGQANGGGHRIRVNASSGDITIEER